MKNTENDSGTGRKNIRVIEVIGPAGAGKTTLYKALKNCPDKFQLSNFPDVHQSKDIPFFINHGLRLFPSLLTISRKDSRQLSRREFAWMTVLRGWPTVLRRESKKTSQIIALDQGPVYLLAEMWELGPEYVRQPAAREFWQDLYARWGKILDMVIWLDASNADLLERIRTRPQDHIVKGETDEAMVEFLDHYRHMFDFTMGALKEKNPNLQVLKYDTGVQSTQAILDDMLIKIEKA